MTENIHRIRLSAAKKIELATTKAPFLLSKVYCEGCAWTLVSCGSIEEGLTRARRLFSNSDATQAGFYDESAVLGELRESGTVFLGHFDLALEDASTLTHE